MANDTYRTCIVCGADLEGKRRDAVYCSASCKQVAYRRRKREEREEQREERRSLWQRVRAWITNNER